MSVASVPSTAAVPSHALRRGTRGFAAVVLLLTGMIAIAIAAFVLPASAIGSGALTVLIPLAIVFAIAHVVAIYGVLRRRAWVVSLTLYLVAIGLGLVAFGLLLVLTGVDPFVRTGAEATFQGRVDTVGLLVWLAGSWIVAARFVVRGMAGPDRPAGEVDSIAAEQAPVGHLVAGWA